MIYNPEDLRKNAVGGDYVSDKRLCLTADGEICDAGDVEARTLLVPEGGTIPGDEARALGLLSPRSRRSEESPSARQGLNSDVDDATNGSDAPSGAPDDDSEDDDDGDDEDVPDTGSGVTFNRPSRRSRN